MYLHLNHFSSAKQTSGAPCPLTAMSFSLKLEITGQPVKAGKHSIPAETLVDCLKRTLDRLFDGGYVQSELVAINPIPSAFLAKVKNLEDCHYDFLAMAKKYKDTIPVIIQENRFDT